MLDAQSAYPGTPPGRLHFIADTILYRSAQSVVILNARSLALVRVLAFWEAYSSYKHTNDHIACITVDPGRKLVVVAMGSRIAAWALSGISQDVWRLHSTLTLPEDQSITTLDSKYGLLAVGTQNGLSVYNSVLENDLPTWSLKWTIQCPTPEIVSFAPSLMYIAILPKNSNVVRIYSTTSGRHIQAIPHPRPVANLRWRQPQATSRDDLLLYTITVDSTLRIFLPVVDAPRTLQLHASLDLYSSLPYTFASTYPDTTSVFWLDRQLIELVLTRILKAHEGNDDVQFRVMKDIVDEKWDLFLRVLSDGSIILSAVANIDRRPPTLLQQFTLKHTPPNTLPTNPIPSYAYILPNPDPTKLTFITSPPLTTYDLSPFEFFNPSSSTHASGQSSSPVITLSGSHLSKRRGSVGGMVVGEATAHVSGLEMLERSMKGVKYGERQVSRFLRSSEGHAVAVLREGGCGEIWKIADGGWSGRMASALVPAIEGEFEGADFVVVLDRGHLYATYSATHDLISLHARTNPTVLHTLEVPKLESLFTYPLPNLSSTSATNDQNKYETESIFGITPDFYIIHIRIEQDTKKMVIISHERLPLLEPVSKSSSLSPPSPSVRFKSPNMNLNGNNIRDIDRNVNGNKIQKIIAVDPMAWGWDIRLEHERKRSEDGSGVHNFSNVNAKGMSNGIRKGRGGWEEHDVLLSVSENGDLAFWVPEQNGLSSGNSSHKNNGNRTGNGSSGKWRCTGRVRTERRGFNRARCSSAKKTALVVPTSEGAELTIWDSMESEFASGLEYCGIFDEPVFDLDWNTTPDMQSILAVGLAQKIDILCQQRMTYFDEGPGWALCHRIDISGSTPYPIGDSVWLSYGSFLVASGHQMSIYGEPRHARKSVPLVDKKEKTDDDKQDEKEEEEEEEKHQNLFEYVARRNGPLENYHPQMILQCLLWDKVELVKDIIVNLAKAVKLQKEHGNKKNMWEPLSVERFLEHGSEGSVSKLSATKKQQYNSLFSTSIDHEEHEGEGFSRTLVEELLETLETEPLLHLTPNEHAHLLVLIQATLEIDEQRRALDSNGLRYLISMRSFYILNQRASSPSSPPTKISKGGTVPLKKTGFRERLRYRDMVWAFYSESQELLVNSCTSACGGKMTWADARALGLPIWLNSLESLKTQMEMIARNEYMSGDNRDPVACSLLYFALGKIKLVHGLWRQAAWHKEQAVMLKFLANDFTQAKWKTSALKNAYALLGKRRFEYAAAFFLLGGSLKDAVNVCVRQLKDFQLAIALARVVEQNNEGPIFKSILKETVLPIAFQTGNRWLGGWAFWLLHQRDLTVRILLTPLQDIATACGIVVEEIGEPHYDDPSLALLFSQLRSKTLQAAKGTSEISGRMEFNFVLQIARVFCRMGCHVLALDLVRSWSFERPSSPFIRNTNNFNSNPNPTPTRQLDVDMDTLSELRSGPPSPPITRRSSSQSRLTMSMFPLESGLRRRSSIMIDMDILSLPPTPARPISPGPGQERPDSSQPSLVITSGTGTGTGTRERRNEVQSAEELPSTMKSPIIPPGGGLEKKEENDLFARKAGLGSLMKSAKQDVQVPEFDMSAFF